MTKVTEYAALVAARRACHRCAGLTNPADVAGGSLDWAQIGPWSLWQGNLDASVMVVGQDWGDVAYFETNRGRDVVRNPTSSLLVELLATAGVEVDPLGPPEPRHTAFFTNEILCLKSGGLQAKVTPAWFRSCGDFLRRQIEIVQPRVVVGLGEHAYRSMGGRYRTGRERSPYITAGYSCATRTGHSTNRNWTGGGSVRTCRAGSRNDSGR